MKLRHLFELYDLDHKNLGRLAFLAHADSKGFTRSREETWRHPTRLPNVTQLGSCLMSATDGDVYIWVLDTKQSIMLVTLNASRGVLTVTAAATSDLTALKWVAKAHKAWPEPETVESQQVKVAFWYQSRQGPHIYYNSLDVPTWEKIKTNYPRADTLTQLASLSNPVEGMGKLILAHGKAGTGKTYWIRALAWEWREWCSLQYITDPDAFFSDASYMMEALMTTQFGDNKPYHLFVCEDVGELMDVDAKTRTGQSLSRLLNITDGILGQGMKILFLLTTNDKLSALHPAVWRPGRCLAELEFPAFTVSEAAAWAEVHGIEAEAKPYTLAELYGLTVGRRSTHREPVAAGFRAPVSNVRRHRVRYDTDNGDEAQPTSS